MDNHPIPQDVTGFQFRLIGNMTVKQFAYVAVGVVGSVILYYIPIFIVVKIVLIPLLILGGVSLAFLPIEGRPIDIMVTHFLKALFAPTQFIYQKNGGHLLLSTIHIDQRAVANAQHAQATGAQQQKTQEQRQVERRQQLNAYLNSLHANQAPDDKEAQRLSSLFGSTTPATYQAQQPSTEAPTQTASVQPMVQTPIAQVPQPVQDTATATPVIPQVPTTPLMQAPVAETPAVTTNDATTPSADNVIQIQKDTEKIAEEDSLMQQVNEELTRAKAAEQGVTGEASQSAHQKVLELEQKIQEIQNAKQKLEEEIQALKAASQANVVTTPEIPSVPVAPVQQTTPVVEPKAVQPAPAPTPAAPAQNPASSGFPSLPDVPNILLGVVRDSSGNVLPHILVEVKDAEDNPVRAFKTNQLGQFLSATPLKEGTYTITLEDPKNQYRFDTQSITVNNQILPPLAIAAHDLREELRKSLFA